MRIECCLLFVQMDLSVSLDPLYWSIVAFASDRFFIVVGLGLAAFCEFIPLSTVAWVMAASLAPCKSNLVGAFKFLWSDSGSLAPSFASLSLPPLPLDLLCPLIHCRVVSPPSLPLDLLCPLIHCKVVVAVLRFRSAAAALKKGAFFIPIHPMSVQSLRCVVTPFITYFESVTIFGGQKDGTVFTSAMIMAISPTWFNCAIPGTLLALFLRSLFANHIPLPQCALSFLLLKHAPSSGKIYYVNLAPVALL